MGKDVHLRSLKVAHDRLAGRSFADHRWLQVNDPFDDDERNYRYRPPFPYGHPVNPDITLHWEAGNTLGLLDGQGTFANGTTINAQATTWPLDFTVTPLQPAVTFKIYVKGQADNVTGEKAVDNIRGRVVNVDLDVDSDYDGKIDEKDEPLEENPGGIVCVCTNNLTPINLKLEPAALPGKLTLSANVDESRIKVWSDNTRTNQVTLPKTWNAGAAVPGTLYVEGISPSATARDVELRLEYNENPVGQNNALFKCADIIRLTILKVDLDGDTDRDGDIDDDDEEGEETNTLTRGILVTPPLRALTAIGNYITGLATLKINVQPAGPILDLTLKLKKKYEASGCTLHFLKTNGEKLPDIGNGQSYSFTGWPANTITLAVMPHYARPLTTSTWPIRFDLELQAVDAGANVVCSDTVRLKIAPMILPPECNTPQKVYTTAIEGIPGATSMDATDAQVWAQDMVKFVKYQIAAGQTGDLFVDLEHSGKGSFLDKLRSEEDWDGSNVWPVDMLGDGGNIMATPSLPDAPFGKLLIGSAKSRKPDPLPYWEGQGVQPTVRITDDWLMVGHVDEILMWVATDKVLYADPWKAADLLHQEIAAGHETNRLWFGFDAAGTNKTIQQVVIAPSEGNFKLTTLPAPGLSNSTFQATLIFSNTVFVADDVLRVDDEILKVTAANGPTVTVVRAQAGRPASAHTTGSVIYAYTDVMKDNLPIDHVGVSVVERMATVTNQLRQAIGLYSATFVPMPVLFEYTTVEGKSGYAAKSANVVNCLLSSGGAICYTETGCTVFREYISSVLPAAEEVMGSWPIHCGYGEIHCATAAQRELDLDSSWWQQIDEWE